MGQNCEFHKVLNSLTPEQKASYESEAATALQRATIQLLVRQPFYGMVLCNMERVPMWSGMRHPTMAVDGQHLFYNPLFVSMIAKGEQRGVLCHEVLHIALMQLKRRKGRDPIRWNKAIDYTVNLIVRDECKLPLPDPLPTGGRPLYDQRFVGMSADRIYRILEEEEDAEKKKKKKGKGDGGDGSGGSDSEGGSDDACPDCQAGGGRPDSFDGHVEDGDITEDEIMDKVVRAAEQARAQGKLPASIDTFLRELRKSRVDWRKFIRGRALDIFNRKDYRPELRSMISGPVARSLGIRATWLPGVGAEEMRTLVVVIDTSGSVSKKLLRAFASEVKGVMELADRTIVITADAAVHEVVEVSKFDDILKQMKFRGGGGTDFCPAFEKLAEMGITDPEMLVYFTDAWGTFPAKKPIFPVIWALTQNHGDVPWGESVVCTEADDE